MLGAMEQQAPSKSTKVVAQEHARIVPCAGVARPRNTGKPQERQGLFTAPATSCCTGLHRKKVLVGAIDADPQNTSSSRLPDVPQVHVNFASNASNPSPHRREGPKRGVLVGPCTDRGASQQGTSRARPLNVTGAHGELIQECGMRAPRPLGHWAVPFGPAPYAAPARQFTSAILSSGASA